MAKLLRNDDDAAPPCVVANAVSSAVNSANPSRRYATPFQAKSVSTVHMLRRAALPDDLLDQEQPTVTAEEYFRLWEAFTVEVGDPDMGLLVGQRVENALFELLPSGRPGIEEVARVLSIRKRSLQRRLRSEGTSYSQVLHRTREKLARHDLLATELSGPEIGFLLGYDDASSFYRAFQEWTGQTPEGLRSQMRRAG